MSRSINIGSNGDGGTIFVGPLLAHGGAATSAREMPERYNTQKIGVVTPLSHSISCTNE
jgi:hypothetical protein